ncbi:antirestriction protein ArdA [Nesterenkonia lacusekhoensis]|uniref:Antirestriction protein n=1 Tax=Nesterenkonia lacusekhoensis TaxID=150832 RepID=A0ABS4T365_9MICC|nr:antirestriction protein ArdA [Nesterenkonia lacusekhoensis]MBP2317726.1 antirestriction protein [Nesterenkonia lacusekhoensis]
MTTQLSAAQQAQINNRNETGQWKQKTHGDIDDTADVLGFSEDDAERPQPVPMHPNRDRSEPKVWLEAEGAHAAGRVVGNWYAAEDAEDVTVADLYRDLDEAPDPDAGDEVAVTDHEGFDIGSHVTLSPSQTVELAQDFETVRDNHGDEGLAAYKAMIEDQGFGDHKPGPDEFSEAYIGDYESKEDWARDLVESSVPNEPQEPYRQTEQERQVEQQMYENLSRHVDMDRLESDLEAEDPGIDYDDYTEVMTHIDRESVEDSTGNSDIGSVVQGWIDDEDYGAIDQHLNHPDYEERAEEAVKAAVKARNGRWLKDNLDYESYARDAELEGAITFLEKNDGLDGVHVLHN